MLCDHQWLPTGGHIEAQIQDHVYEKRVKGYLANSMHYLWREKRQMSGECENHIYIYL